MAYSRFFGGVFFGFSESVQGGRMTYPPLAAPDRMTPDQATVELLAEAEPSAVDEAMLSADGLRTTGQ